MAARTSPDAPIETNSRVIELTRILPVATAFEVQRKRELDDDSPATHGRALVSFAPGGTFIGMGLDSSRIWLGRDPRTMRIHG